MKLKLFIITLLTLLVIGCTREPLPEPEREGGKIVTISATIPPETRVLYDDTDRSLSWQDGDQLLLAGYGASGHYIDCATFTWQAGNTFTGTEVQDAITYKAYYPAGAITLNETTGDVQLPDNFWEQTQDGDGTTGHLRNKLLLFDETAKPITQTFSLVAKSSIIKLILSGIPQEVGALRKLIYTVETAPGVFKSVPLNVTDVTFSASTSSLTTFLAVDPAVIKIAANGKVIIRLKGNKLYQWSQSVTDGKEYVAGNRYTGAVSSGWADITTPLYYVAEYNVTQAGDSFVTDLTSCSGSGYFTWSEAFDLFNNTTTIGGVNYHWPSSQEWFGIVPKYVKTGYYVHFKNQEYSYNNIYESVKVRSEFFNVYSNFRTTPNDISYALRYRNTVWYSAWRYEYITDGNNTHMKITSRKVASSVNIDKITENNGAFWNTDTEKDIVRYFPAGGYGSSSYQGERGYFWSSTEHSNNNSYAWYMLFNTDRAYSNNTPKIFSNTVRLFYD